MNLGTAAEVTYNTCKTPPMTFNVIRVAPPMTSGSKVNGGAHHRFGVKYGLLYGLSHMVSHLPSQPGYNNSLDGGDGIPRWRLRDDLAAE